MSSQIRRLIAERLTADQFGHSPWKDAFDKIAWSVRVRPVSKKYSRGDAHFHLYYKELQNMGAVKVYTIGLLKHWASLLPQATDNKDPIRDITGENTGLAIHVDTKLINKLVLDEIKEKGDKYGITSEYHDYRENQRRRIEANPKNLNIVLEFSSPNIAKQFHAGHVRSTLLGNFISNISKSLGHDITRINYLGDFGTQFGLLGVGYEKYGSHMQMEVNPIKHLYEIYVKINAATKDDHGNPTEIYQKGLDYFNRLEQGDDDCYSFWDSCRSHSIKEFKSMYKRLGVEFDEFHGEAMYNRAAQKLVSDMKELGIAQVDKLTGVTYIPIPQQDGTKYHASLLKSNGSTLYLTRDIAAILDRYDRYKFDRMFYVVEKGQQKHFQSLIGAVHQLGHAWGEGPVNDFHVQFGRVEGMSSRKGDVVLLRDILDEAQFRMLASMQSTKSTKVTDQTEMAEIADILGKSAIIVQDLKERRIKNYKFSWERMLQFKGDTGVFLQYAHARLCSLEEKCGIPLPTEWDESLLTEDCACNLVQHLARYDEVLHQAFQELDPYHVTHFLFMLCRLVNIANRELRVIGEPTEVAEARMVLFHCSRVVLASGLKLLGVVPLSRM